MGAAPVCTANRQTCPAGAAQENIVGCCCAFATGAKRADSARPIAIGWYPAMIAQPADARTSPSVAATGRLAGTVENRRNRLVGELTGERRDELDYVGAGSPTMLADSVLLHAQRRMIAASPSDHQLDRVVLDPHNDLLDQRTDDSFPSSRRSFGCRGS